MIINREYVISTFNQYVAAYNANDPKIKLKLDHTFRVAQFSEEIAASIGANPDLAWLIGMLHDIGRFEQVRRYNTFIDSVSVNHAEFGADLLFHDNLARQFFDTSDQQLSRLVEISIRNHNRFRIQEGLSEEELMYCKIIRDADKIDIFRVNVDTPLEDIYNVSTEELLNSSVSNTAKECFINKTTILRSLIETVADRIVGHACMIFELEFPKSRQLAHEQGYVQKMLEFPSKNPDTIQWFEFMQKEAQIFLTAQK